MIEDPSMDGGCEFDIATEERCDAGDIEEDGLGLVERSAGPWLSIDLFDANDWAEALR